MAARAGRIAKAAFTLSLLALAAATALPALTGRPLVSYASSASMEPTIGVLDGFFVDPWPASVEAGDIIVFYSVTRQGPAVHRVVAVEPEGWITQGDANEGPDQLAGEPLVTRERLLGKVITRADGEPILVERLGATLLEGRARLVVVENAVGGPRQLVALAFLGLALSFAVPAFLARGKRELPSRMPLRTRVALRRLLPRGVLGRHVAIVLAAVVLASSLLAAANARHDVVSTMIVLQDPSAADEMRAAGPGMELRRAIDVSSLALFPTVVLLEGDPSRVRVQEPALLRPNVRSTVEVWQRGGDVVGLQEDVVGVWRYPAFLPPRAIVGLHEAAPGSPYLLLGALVVAAGAAWLARLRIGTLPVARTLGLREDWL